MPTLKHSSDTFELLDRHPFMEFPQYKVFVPGLAAGTEGNSFDLVDPAHADVLKDGEFVVKTVSPSGAQVIRRVTETDINALGLQPAGAAVAFSLFQVHGMPGRTDLQTAKAMPIVNEVSYRFRYKLVGIGDEAIDPDTHIGRLCTLAIGPTLAGPTTENVYLTVPDADAWCVAAIDAVDADGWVQFRRIPAVWVTV